MSAYQRNFFRETPVSTQVALPFAFANSTYSAKAGDMTRTFILYACSKAKDRGLPVPSLSELQSAWNDGLTIDATVNRLATMHAETVAPIPFLAEQSTESPSLEGSLVCDALGLTAHAVALAPQACASTDEDTALADTEPTVGPIIVHLDKEEKIALALKMILYQKYSVTMAARIVGLPRTTIRNRVKGINSARKPRPTGKTK